MYHEQQCCEGVWLEDLAGDLDDLVGHPLLEAEEVSNYAGPDTDHTWTYYKMGTIKGHVSFRWCGTSNGYS